MSQGISWSWRHAIAQSDLKSTTKHVLLTVSLFMNDMGEGCYPTTIQIAKYSSLSERAVCEHLDIAEKAGWITKKQHGFSGRKWKNHEYLPCWIGRETQKQALTRGTDFNDNEALTLTRGTDFNDNEALTQGQSNVPRNLSNEYNTSKSANADCPECASDTETKTPKLSKTEYSELFLEVWKSYPSKNKRRKNDAWKKFKRLTIKRQQVISEMIASRHNIRREEQFNPELSIYIGNADFDEWRGEAGSSKTLNNRPSPIPELTPEQLKAQAKFKADMAREKREAQEAHDKRMAQQEKDGIPF